VPVRRRWDMFSLSGIRERVIFEVRAEELKVTRVATVGTSVTRLARSELGIIHPDSQSGKLMLSRTGLSPLDVFISADTTVAECVVQMLHEAMDAPLQQQKIVPEALVSKPTDRPARRGPQWAMEILLPALGKIMHWRN
jgi:hypothetical protein